MAKKMRVVQVPQAKGAFEIVERDIPEPQASAQNFQPASNMHRSLLRQSSVAAAAGSGLR